MSYPDLPGVLFDGDFQADVSTANNDVRNFDIDTFDPGTSDGRWYPAAAVLFDC